MSLFSKIFDNSGVSSADEYMAEMKERASEFDSDEDYLDSLKKDDSYHFSFPFEYYKYENDNGQTGYMEVDVEWDYDEHGYEISYSIPGDYDIDPDYMGDEEDIYESQIESRVTEELVSMGIPLEAIEV